MFRFKLNYSTISLLQRVLVKKQFKYNSPICAERITNLKFISTITEKITPQIQPEKSSEEEFLAKLKNDPDIFGDREEIQTDAGDIKEEKYFTEQPHPSKKLSTKQYADIIKSFIRKRKIKEALDVLEIRMIKEDRVKPENYIYNLLLGACGRVGYTKKAFSLFNKMKQRGLVVTGGTYTALFNACSNSPWPLTDGLSRAQHLRTIMIEKQFQPNVTTYNAMIKAFGRCGDLSIAFSIVDEMISKKISVKDDTINFLLQACISDKEAGFRHALLVWRKMVNKNIKPSIYTYNLMLKSIKDCGLGDVEVTKDVIEKLLKTTNSQQKLVGEKADMCLKENMNSTDAQNLSSGNTEGNTFSLTENINTDAQVVLSNSSTVDKSIDNFRPNLMAKTPTLGNIISLSEVTKPEDRLLLVGGYNNFLQNMEENECKPDIKTFTQLLGCLPNTIAAENNFLSIMKKLNCKPDIDFYNMLIKKRSMRFDYEGAKDVMRLIRKIGYRPDIVTYGVLALGCKTKEEAIDLIDKIKNDDVILNAEILGAMLHQACYHNNFFYVIEIMDTCLSENVEPNVSFMSCLEEFYKRTKDLKATSKSFEKGQSAFRMRYREWIKLVKTDSTEDAHPWQQYRQTTEGNNKYFKTKDTARFKPKRASLFKVKTSLKHKTKNKNY